MQQKTILVRKCDVTQGNNRLVSSAGTNASDSSGKYMLKVTGLT